VQRHPLTPDALPLLKRYLCRGPHLLSGFSPVQILLWRPFFDITWMKVKRALCLFYEDAAGCFMPLPPLGPVDAATMEACAAVMMRMNRESPVSRIENIAAEDLELFRQLGWRVYEKGPEYIVRRLDIAVLRGERFRHRRNVYNRFLRQPDICFRDYQSGDRSRVLGLYRRWARGRRAATEDPVARQMLKDSGRALEHMLDRLPRSCFIAKVVEAAGRLVAFTSGDPVSPDVFCVHFEVADRGVPGAAQFIFTELARTLACPLINMMDDAGLPSLRESKLLMRPVMTPMAYCASPV